MHEFRCILDFSLAFTSHISYPTLESCSGGFLNTPLFQSSDGFLTQLNCGVPSQPPSFAGSFLLFISSHRDFSLGLLGLNMLQVTLQLSFSVSGREIPTVGPGHSPQLNPSHLGGITPTLPISLREFFWVFLSFGEIWLYCNLMRYSAIIYRLLDESIAPLVSGKIFHP